MEARITVVQDWRNPWVLFVGPKEKDPSPTTEEMVRKLQKKLQIPRAHISQLEREVKCLDGLPLKAEVARRTEVAIFRACYEKVLGPPMSYEEMFVQHDQRVYEFAEFVGGLRLQRVGQGVLPYYVLQTYHDVCAKKVPR